MTMTSEDPDRAFEEAVRSREAAEKASTAPLPTAGATGDLALRLALVKKGVLTDADLDDAQHWLGKARAEGRVLYLEPDEAGEMRWRLLTMEELRAALGKTTVAL